MGDVKADEKEVVFFFDEDLCFNIPFKPARRPVDKRRPVAAPAQGCPWACGVPSRVLGRAAQVVTVTGRCVLTRDPASGLIVQYREYWDKTPSEVIKTAFGRPKKA